MRIKLFFVALALSSLTIHAQTSSPSTYHDAYAWGLRGPVKTVTFYEYEGETDPQGAEFTQAGAVIDPNAKLTRDARGLLISYLLTDEDGVSGWKWEYNADSLVTKKMFIMEGNVYRTMTYEYNAQGTLIRSTVSSDIGEDKPWIEHIDYKVVSRDQYNWTKREKSNNRNGDDVETQVITYYKK